MRISERHRNFLGGDDGGLVEVEDDDVAEEDKGVVGREVSFGVDVGDNTRCAMGCAWVVGDVDCCVVGGVGLEGDGGSLGIGFAWGIWWGRCTNI